MLDSGKSIRAVAEKFDCGRTQISNIKLEKDSVMHEWETGGRTDIKYIKKRKTTYEDLNTRVWDWFCKARSKNLPVSGKLIQVIIRPIIIFFFITF